MTTLISFDNLQKFTTFVKLDILLFIEIIKKDHNVIIEYTDKTFDEVDYESFKNLIKQLKKTKLWYIPSYKNPMFVNVDKIVQCYLNDTNILIIFDGFESADTDDELYIHFKSSKNAEKAFYRLHKAIEKRLKCNDNILNEIREMMYFHPPCDGGIGYQKSLKEFGNLQN